MAEQRQQAAGMAGGAEAESLHLDQQTGSRKAELEMV